MDPDKIDEEKKIVVLSDITLKKPTVKQGEKFFFINLSIDHNRIHFKINKNSNFNFISQKTNQVQVHQLKVQVIKSWHHRFSQMNCVERVKFLILTQKKVNVIFLFQFVNSIIFQDIIQFTKLFV